MPDSLTPVQSAWALLRHETRFRVGTVPTHVDGQPVADGSFRITPREMLMRELASGLAIHYRKGAGVTVERLAGHDPLAEDLYLNGSVHAAAASINGLMPLHASAIALEGTVIRFSGIGGAGKSTLVAGLGRRGLPMFCDDTLIIVPGTSGPPMCLPGHKRLKLTDEAIALTGADPAERVWIDSPKRYARPPAGEISTPLPLGLLVFLEVGDVPSLTPIAGGERFARLRDEHCTVTMFAGGCGLDARERFALETRLARDIPMAIFRRPRDISRLEEGIDTLVAELSRRTCKQ